MQRVAKHLAWMSNPIVATSLITRPGEMLRRCLMRRMRCMTGFRAVFRLLYWSLGSPLHHVAHQAREGAGGEAKHLYHPENRSN